VKEHKNTKMFKHNTGRGRQTVVKTNKHWSNPGNN